MGRSHTPYHLPVMAAEVADLMEPVHAGVIVDATFGGGGHARMLLDRLPGIRLVALDRDPDAEANAADLGDRVTFRQEDFRHLDTVLDEEGIDEIAGAVFDLGVSSHQLDVGERGFSYHLRGPVDMRMGPDAPFDAGGIVNRWERSELITVLRRYGEERHAVRIADAIVAGRPIADTAELARVVADAVPARSRRHGHPARRTFQALRIAVNDELAALAEGIDVALRMLRPRGRLVVISYHSLEDRIVKRRLAAGARGCVCPPDLPVCGCGGAAELRLLTRRPLRPSSAEIEANPRARSARMRAAEKVSE